MKINMLRIVLMTLTLMSPARADDDEYYKTAYYMQQQKQLQVALSYIDCDGEVTVRNGRFGHFLDGRFVADVILGATYVGVFYVLGGEDKRYTLLYSSDLTHVTFAAASGGSRQAKCRPVPSITVALLENVCIHGQP